MKNFAKLLLVGGLLTTSLGAQAQAFQETYSRLGVDFNHYSIETTPKGYVCAGTLFDQGSGNKDIHVFMIDPNGSMIWEKVIDESIDDRALDIVYTEKEGIAITGYISPSGQGFGRLYVAKIDMSGNLIVDQTISGYSSSAGTNIIYSKSTEGYIVGGLYADQFGGTTLGGNEALIVEFDNSLNYVNHKQFSTTDQDYASINDIVEIPGQGYFVTGGVGLPFGFPNYASQGVLALFLNPALNIVYDLSFESTNHAHVGVSAIYAQSTDQIYLMSNNSIIHNPEIMTIDDASISPTISNSYALVLDPQAGPKNAAGFELKESNWNSNNLIVAGYFKTYFDGMTTNNTTPWITEIEKSSGAPVSSYVWPVTAPNFYAHGGGTFSTFTGVQPYHFNQEILTERVDNKGYALIGPRRVNAAYGIDIMTTYGGGGMPCYDNYPYSVIQRNYVEVNGIVSSATPISSGGVFASLTGLAPTNQTVFCTAMKASASPVVTDQNGAEGSADNISTVADIDGIEFNIAPNPFNENFAVKLIGEGINGQISVLNPIGQIVYQSETITTPQYFTQINSEGWEKGMYIVKYMDINGNTKIQKAIKL